MERSSKQGVIQIIDDEPDVLIYLSSFLEDHGFEVHTAHDAGTGLEMIRKNPPDLILLDIMMPGHSGLHLLMSVRGDQNLAKIPVLLVTGTDKVRLPEFGAYLAGYGIRAHDALVEKPIDPILLLEKIRCFIPERRKLEGKDGPESISSA